jgi:hypothetical protein
MEIEYLFPQPPVWIKAEKCLAQRDETRNVEDRIKRELIQLHAINKKEPTKEFVGRKRKAAKEEGGEHHPEIICRARNDLIAGEHTSMDSWRKSRFLGLGQFPLGNGRCGPAHGRAPLLGVLHNWASEHSELHSHAKGTFSSGERVTMASSSRESTQGGRRSGGREKQLQGKKLRRKGFHP